MTPITSGTALATTSRSTTPPLPPCSSRTARAGCGAHWPTAACPSPPSTRTCPFSAIPRPWYRAAGALTNVEVGAVSVPTLYIWGDADATVGRAAAEWTREFATGPFRFEALPGIGHFVTDEAPDVVTRLLLDHLAHAR
jgi:pimeloyl-ACP methyl ester carboxylesterase